MSKESSRVRLERLLTMVPWVLAHPGEDVEAVAAAFHISAAQARKDITLLSMCGTPSPGMTADTLIDASTDGGFVYISNADELERPMRLGPDEALTLSVALRAMNDVPGVVDPQVATSVLAKLAAATGFTGDEDTDELTRRIRIDLADDESARWLGPLREAIRNRRQVQLTYLNHARDEVTERLIEPWTLHRQGAAWYVWAWCHRAGAERTFRLDRIQALTATTTPRQYDPPESTTDETEVRPLFQPAAGAMEVTLRVHSSQRWMIDYYGADVLAEPAENTQTGSESAESEYLLVAVTVNDPSWVRRLVWQTGGQVQVVSPVHLAADIERGALRALDAYQ